MGDVLSEADVARILKVPEDTVRRLFEETVLTGTRDGDAWQTTGQILDGDLSILIEGERIERLRGGKHGSPWSGATSDQDKSVLTPEKILKLLEKLESGHA